MQDSNGCDNCRQVFDQSAQTCKRCNIRAINLAAVKRYQAKNPNAKREYAQKNKEKLKLYQREWRKKNQDKSAEYNKRAREKNPESSRASHRKYSQNNPEYIRYKSAKRRALAKNNGVFFISRAELKKLYLLPCFYCQGKAAHLEHVVPLSRGGQHSIGNLVPACASCNLQKNDRFITEWKMSQLRAKL